MTKFQRPIFLLIIVLATIAANAQTAKKAAAPDRVTGDEFKYSDDEVSITVLRLTTRQAVITKACETLAAIESGAGRIVDAAREFIAARDSDPTLGEWEKRRAENAGLDELRRKLDEIA